jgi:hypothetical protein
MPPLCDLPLELENRTVDSPSQEVEPNPAVVAGPTQTVAPTNSSTIAVSRQAWTFKTEVGLVLELTRFR